MENEISNNNKANEPGTRYAGLRRIRVYSSFVESDEEQYLHWAKLTPEESLSEFFTIMSRFYTFNKPVWKGTKIHMDR